MNKYKLFLALLPIIMLITSSCTNTAETTHLNFDYAMAHANHRRQIINRPTDAFVASMGTDEGIEPVYIEHYITPSSTPHFVLTTEQATADIYLMFDMLRSLYGAYHYFGGDDVFLPLRERTIAALYTESMLSANILDRIIFDNLATVIKDGHFILGNRYLSPSVDMFSFDEYFERTEKGFRHINTGAHVLEVVGHTMEDVFRLALTEDGEFAYAIVILGECRGPTPAVHWQFLNDHRHNQRQHYPLVIRLDNGDTIEKDLPDILTSPFTVSIPGNRFMGPDWRSELRHEGDIPILSSRFFVHPAMEYGQFFMSTAYDLQEEPIIIVDIRGNGGGNVTKFDGWLYRLMGNTVYPTFNTIDRWHNITWPEDLTWESNTDENGPQAFTYNKNPYQNNKTSEPLIIMLTNRINGSSAEWVVSQMFNLENTLIIGQNTAGGLLSDGQRVSIYLPYSNIRLLFSPIGYIYPPGHFAEGVGFAPDVWVNGCALEATLAMLARR